MCDSNFVFIFISPVAPPAVSPSIVNVGNNTAVVEHANNSTPVTPNLNSTLDPTPPRASNVLRLMNNFEDRIVLQMEDQQRRHEQVERELREQVNQLNERLNEENKARNVVKVQIPPGISSSVRCAYAVLGAENGWHFDKRFTCPENECVNARLKQALIDTTTVCDDRAMRKAIRRYFESQKRKERLVAMPPENLSKNLQENRRATRRHRLFRQRDKLEKDGADKEVWSEVTVWQMSDVETDDDSIIKHRSLVWRSAEVVDLICRCDASLQVTRLYGYPSQRAPRL